MSALAQGYTLMAVGMAMVGLFLGLMVALMNGAAKLFARFAHLFPEPELTKPRAKAATAADDGAVIAAIAAALHAKNNARGKG